MDSDTEAVRACPRRWEWWQWESIGGKGDICNTLNSNNLKKRNKKKALSYKKTQRQFNKIKRTVHEQNKKFNR